MEYPGSRKGWGEVIWCQLGGMIMKEAHMEFLPKYHQVAGVRSMSTAGTRAWHRQAGAWKGDTLHTCRSGSQPTHILEGTMIYTRRAKAWQSNHDSDPDGRSWDSTEVHQRRKHISIPPHQEPQRAVCLVQLCPASPILQDVSQHPYSFSSISVWLHSSGVRE